MNLFRLFQSACRSQNASSSPRRTLRVEHLEARWVLNAAWEHPASSASSPSPAPSATSTASFELAPATIAGGTSPESSIDDVERITGDASLGATFNNVGAPEPEQDDGQTALNGGQTGQGARIVSVGVNAIEDYVLANGQVVPAEFGDTDGAEPLMGAVTITGTATGATQDGNGKSFTAEQAAFLLYRRPDNFVANDPESWGVLDEGGSLEEPITAFNLLTPPAGGVTQEGTTLYAQNVLNRTDLIVEEGSPLHALNHYLFQEVGADLLPSELGTDYLNTTADGGTDGTTDGTTTDAEGVFLDALATQVPPTPLTEGDLTVLNTIAGETLGAQFATALGAGAATNFDPSALPDFQSTLGITAYGGATTQSTAEPAPGEAVPNGTGSNGNGSTDGFGSCRFRDESFANGDSGANWWNRKQEQQQEEEAAAVAETSNLGSELANATEGVPSESSAADLAALPTDATATDATTGLATDVTAAIPPADTLPTDTLPTDTLPTDTLPTDTLPTDTLPTDGAITATNALAATNGPALRAETVDPFFAQLGGDSAAIETLEPLGTVPPREPLSPIQPLSPIGSTSLPLGLR